jgi:hypothetical protein
LCKKVGTLAQGRPIFKITNLKREERESNICDEVKGKRQAETRTKQTQAKQMQRM